MLAGFVRYTSEAQASHLARRVRLRAFWRRSFQGWGVAVIRRLEALVSSVMSFLLHPLFFVLSTESPSPIAVSFAFIAGYVAVRICYPPLISGDECRINSWGWKIHRLSMIISRLVTRANMSKVLNSVICFQTRSLIRPLICLYVHSIVR